MLQGFHPEQSGCSSSQAKSAAPFDAATYSFFGDLADDAGLEGELVGALGGALEVSALAPFPCQPTIWICASDRSVIATLLAVALKDELEALPEEYFPLDSIGLPDEFDSKFNFDDTELVVNNEEDLSVASMLRNQSVLEQRRNLAQMQDQMSHDDLLSRIPGSLQVSISDCTWFCACL